MVTRTQSVHDLRLRLRLCSGHFRFEVSSVGFGFRAYVQPTIEVLEFKKAS